MPRLLLAFLSLPVLAVAALALALAFGGPAEPGAMASINNPFRSVDFSRLPRSSGFQARDGARLAYRAYPPAPGPALGGVVLVHGSSASSASMHVLAQALAAAGHAVYALDVRGHGESGTRGRIAYVGQLEDDLEDFLGAVRPPRPLTLAGFSSGGGFALRFASGPRQQLFDRYLLLSPYLGPDAPTSRRDGGGWVKVGVPRLVALALLNAAGVRAFNDLPVLRFALDPRSRSILTPQYSFSLMADFGAPRDYRAAIRAAGRPMRLVAGQDDELIITSRFQEVFRAEGKEVPVTLVPGIGHIPLILAPEAVAAVVQQAHDQPSQAPGS